VDTTGSSSGDIAGKIFSDTGTKVLNGTETLINIGKSLA